MWEEDDGKASFARISSALVLVSWLGWVNYIVFKTVALPSGMWEISTVVGVLYSLNKVATVVANSQKASVSSSVSTVTEATKSSTPDSSESPIH